MKKLMLNSNKNHHLTFLILMLLCTVLLVYTYFFTQQTTFVLVFSFLVLILVAKGIASGWYAQSVVLLGGVALLFVSAFINPGISIAAKASGSPLLDVFVSIKETFSQQAAGLGLTIMVIAGFSRYMNEIGASDKLVDICVVPLRKVKSRYILLGLSYVVMQCLSLFIPSASGLGLLMMATMYPVLRSVGCSKESVAAIIASGVCIDFGPAASSMIVGAEVANVDLFGFFVYEQLPVAVFIIPSIAILHMIMLRYWDNKCAEKNQGQDKKLNESTDNVKEKNVSAPLFYAFLPAIPMCLLFVFSELSESFLPPSLRFHVDVVSALLFSFALSLVVDIIMTRDIKQSLSKVSSLFDQMGKAFISIVSIIFCAQVLANGMMKIGVINILFNMVPTGNHTTIITVIIFSLLIFLGSVLLGTGTTFNAFAPVAGEVAKVAGIPMAGMLIPMQFASSFGRTLSPIAGIVLAVAAIVGISPAEIVKRNSVQMIAAFLLSILISFYIQ
ncbi:TPA: C4-dicarboxylate transporter DcuC [Klebsiella oxytoca]|nr:C4-dicarboxylate transporter DcuC [Klebsiella oxytoca]